MKKKSAYVVMIPMFLSLAVVSTLLAYPTHLAHEKGAENMFTLCILFYLIVLIMPLFGLTHKLVDAAFKPYKAFPDAKAYAIASAAVPTIIMAPVFFFREDTVHAAISMSLAYAAFALWGALPGMALRRVRRFEYGLAKNGIISLSSDQARARVKMMLPFLAHPATIFYLAKAAFSAGDFYQYNNHQVKADAGEKHKAVEEEYTICSSCGGFGTDLTLIDTCPFCLGHGRIRV